MLKKIIYFIIALLVVPVIILMGLMCFPLLIVFFLFLSVITRRRSRAEARRQDSREGDYDASSDIVDVDCEVMDEDRKKGE